MGFYVHKLLTILGAEKRRGLLFFAFHCAEYFKNTRENLDNYDNYTNELVHYLSFVLKNLPDSLSQ